MSHLSQKQYISSDLVNLIVSYLSVQPVFDVYADEYVHSGLDYRKKCQLIINNESFYPYNVGRLPIKICMLRSKSITTTSKFELNLLRCPYKLNFGVVSKVNLNELKDVSCLTNQWGGSEVIFVLTRF